MKLADLKLIFTLRCHEASELASAALDRELTASERWALRLHVFVCKPCRHLLKHLKAMREMLRSAPPTLHASAAGAEQLSAERRRKITRLLSEADGAEAS